jgi:hypothetical protein
LGRFFPLRPFSGAGQARDAPGHGLGIDVEFGRGRLLALHVLGLHERARARGHGLAECVDRLQLVAG